MKLFSTWPTLKQAETQALALQRKGYKTKVTSRTETNEMYGVTEYVTWIKEGL